MRIVSFALIAALASPLAACSGTTEGTERQLCEDYGDGVADDLGTSVDQNGDGYPDAFDKDGDGFSDGLLIDTNDDGIPEGPGFDLSGNCVIDAVDTDRDGFADEFSDDSVDYEDKRAFVPNEGH